MNQFWVFCSFLPHIEAMTKDFFIIVKLNVCLINYAVSQILNVNSFWKNEQWRQPLEAVQVAP